MESSVVPKSAVDAVVETLASVDDLSSNLLRLLSLADDPDVLAELPPLHRARTFLFLANAASTLLSVRLRCSGIQPDDHPIRKEFERLTLYEEKLQRFDAWSKKPLRPSTSLNYKAATRFIAHSLPDLTPEQRKDMRDISRGEHVRSRSFENHRANKKRKQASEKKSARVSAQEFLEKAQRELLSYNNKMKGPQPDTSGDEEE